ncbi:hypothetical protein KAH94_04110 [bacterium]|nr:hypothetical protein [bacterium]
MYYNAMKKKKLFILPFFFFSLFKMAQTFTHDVDITVERFNNPYRNEEKTQGAIVQLYFIKRLEKAAKLLQTIHKKKIFPSLCKAIEGNCKIFNDTSMFHNKKIKQCITSMETKKSLKPFVTLWETVKDEAQNTNPEFLREFSILILEIYKAIFTACSPLIQATMYKNTFLHALALLCGNITGLQAFEILSIIDKLTAQIPKLLEKYELTNKKITWKKWLIKYWWLPPMATAAIIFEAIFIYQIATGKKKLPKLKSAMTLFSKENKKK